VQLRPRPGRRHQPAQQPHNGATTLEGYSYLGLGTVVDRTHPQPGAGAGELVPVMSDGTRETGTRDPAE
jgi:hypothetical protein